MTVSLLLLRRQQQRLEKALIESPVEPVEESHDRPTSTVHERLTTS